MNKENEKCKKNIRIQKEYNKNNKKRKNLKEYDTMNIKQVYNNGHSFK